MVLFQVLQFFFNNFSFLLAINKDRYCFFIYGLLKNFMVCLRTLLLILIINTAILKMPIIVCKNNTINAKISKTIVFWEYL